MDTSNSEPDQGTPSTNSIFNCRLDYSWLGKQHPGRSLGRLAEDCFGPVEMTEGIPCPTSRPTFRFATLPFADNADAATIRALVNWYRLHCLFFLDKADKIFSWEQRYSYQLLYDWWSAAFRTPSMLRIYLLAFLNISDTLRRELKDENKKNHWELWVCLAQHTKALCQDDSLQQPDLKQSGYDKVIMELFILEFYNPKSYLPQNRYHLTTLVSNRRAAAFQAYCYQATMYCFKRQLYNPSLLDESEESEGYPWICSFKASDPSYRRTLSRGPLIRSCPWLDPKTSTSPRFKPSQENGEEEGDSLDGWPEYLWDIANKRTVRSRDLKEPHPSYVAISHTWGRWQQNDDKVLIPGGLDIPIPQNTKFDVKKLPDTLSSLRSKTQIDYLWLDLVCIPQAPPRTEWNETDEGNYEAHAKVQQNEIARQGSIFRNAQIAIAWLHDVEDLTCLLGVFEYLSLKALSFDPNSADDKELSRLQKDACTKVYGRTTGLVCQERGKDRYKKKKYSIRVEGNREEYREPSGWFTSLWTLQEVCLRPDMWLATSDWDIMSFDADTPVPLSGILSVIKYGLRAQPGLGEEVKDAMQEVTEWSATTGMDDLLLLSKIDILRLGDRRYCQDKEKRVQAIMSAIGATKWFSSDRDSSAELILEKYPPMFIQEVREAVPGAFFTTFTKVPYTDPDDSSLLSGGSYGRLHGRGLVGPYTVSLDHPKELDLSGSLLPFSKIGHFYERMQSHAESHLELDTHESVQSWGITISGRVQIQNACIISSSLLDDISKSPKVLLGRFWGFSAHFKQAGAISNELDIHKWAKERKSEIHIVVVTYAAIEPSKLPESGMECAAEGGSNSESDVAIEYTTRQRHVVQGIVLRCISEDTERAAAKQGKERGADGKPQRLVRIGNFHGYSSSKIILPEARSVDWEVL